MLQAIGSIAERLKIAASAWVSASVVGGGDQAGAASVSVTLGGL